MKNIVRWIFRRLPVVISRLIRSYFHRKEWFLLKQSPNVFTEIYEKNFWNSPESKSGEGSALAATVTIREQLPLVIAQYSIQSMLDVPCGDYNWMKEVPKACSYIGGDIVPEIIERNQKLYGNEKVQFKHIDITSDTLPKVDLIFCKDCLQHLSYKNVQAALDNFKKSGSKYLLVSSYPKTLRNHDIYDGDFRSLNLFKKPFHMTRPLLKIREKSKVPGVGSDKVMYLFSLS